MNNFDLFMGCLGNGITVYNKAIEENGDYKKIAHIRETGKIKWYIDPSNVQESDLLRIEHAANVQEEKWEKWFSAMPQGKQYEFLLDRLPLSYFLEITKRKDLDLWQKIRLAKQAYYKAS